MQVSLAAAYRAARSGRLARLTVHVCVRERGMACKSGIERRQ